MKCKFCKTTHRNNGENGIKDTCFNCEFIENSLSLFVESINRWVPISTGKCNRKLTISGFKIEKIK